MPVKEIKLKPVKTKQPKGVKAGMPKTPPGVQGLAMIVKNVMATVQLRYTEM